MYNELAKKNENKASSSAELISSDIDIEKKQLKIDSHFYSDIQRSRDSYSFKSNISLKTQRMLWIVCGDALALIFCIIAGYFTASQIRLVIFDDRKQMNFDFESLSVILFFVPILLHFWFCWGWGHYTRFKPTWTETREIFKLASYIVAADTIILFALKVEFSRLWLCLFACAICIFIPLTRVYTKRIMTAKNIWFRSTYVVGTGDNAIATALALESDSAMGCRIDGFVDLTGKYAPGQQFSGKGVISGIPLKTSPNYLEHPNIIFAFDSLAELNEHRASVNRYVAACSHVTFSPPMNGLPIYGAELLDVFKHDSFLLKLHNNINMRRSQLIKRFFDIVISGSAILVLSPVFLILHLLVSTDGHASIYRHTRLGRDGVKFNCLKFRSMKVNSQEILEEYLSKNIKAREEWSENQKLFDDPRVTNIGKFLRSTSLDELPQLINVFKGQMSIVGPRPIVTNEASRYGDYLPYYFAMLPGITGLWQTSGRSNTSYDERVLLDVWYARNWSLWHDIIILIRTIPALMAREGAR